VDRIGELNRTGLNKAPESAALHRALASFNARRLRPGIPSAQWRVELTAAAQDQATELEFLEGERAAVRAEASRAPREVGGFLAWFEALEQTGPGQGDALFPFLAEHTTSQQLRWFLEQEVAGEAGFDDLVALTQVKLPTQAKLELARNYWDEMGRGVARGMHGPMLEGLSHALALDPRPERVVWESLALANLMSAMAANRAYTYHSVGALGVVELTAPGRAELVNAGLKRIGIPPATRQYFALHATLDIKHSEAWNREVLTSLIAADPELALPLAEGALMRLAAGARCFGRYRHALGVGTA
jgi:hypothetical protein